MVFVPAGKFRMGSDFTKDAKADPTAEPEIHDVILDAYWIDKTEVTNRQYRICVENGGCPALRKMTYQDESLADFPVVWVSWSAAHGYCEWVGRRLPTEAEWEKAARWIDGRIYPWGDTFDGTRLNYCDTNCLTLANRDPNVDDGYSKTAPADSFPGGASRYGVLNMAGNVWEWVDDGATAPNAPASNSDGKRVLKGGAFYSKMETVRSANRFPWDPTDPKDSFGFRCASTP